MLNKDQYLQKRRELSQKLETIKADIDSLDRAWSLFNVENKWAQVESTNDPKSKSFTETVRDVIHSKGDNPFSIKDIMADLHSSNPNYSKNRNGIATIIMRMKNKGQIKLHIPGKGRSLSYYKVNK